MYIARGKPGAGNKNPLSSLSRKHTLFLSLDFLPHPAGLMVQTVNNQLIINTTIGYNRGTKFV